MPVIDISVNSDERITSPGGARPCMVTEVRRAQRLLRLATMVGLTAVGLAASHAFEEDMRIARTSLRGPRGSIPALRFDPATGNVKGTALLLHGVTASKETLVVLGEALAMSGYVALAIDLPGHGASTEPMGSGAQMTEVISAAARALDPEARIPRLDLLLGHSMGAYQAARALRAHTVEADRFIALGARPDLDGYQGQVLLAAGAQEEALSVEALRRSSSSREALVIAAACDHALEPWHPTIVAAVLEFTGSPDLARTRWLLRVVGPALTVLGGGLLVHRILRRLALARPGHPLLLGGIAGAAACALMASTMTGWVGVWPSCARIPLQLGFVALLGGAGFLIAQVLGTGRARASRGGMLLALGFTVAALASGAVGQPFAGLGLVLLSLVMLAGAGVARVVEHAVQDPAGGAVAFVITVGYVLGCWLPRTF